MAISANDRQLDTLDWQESFQTALNREILLGERRRVTMLAALIALIACIYIFFSFAPGLVDADFRNRLHERWPWMISLCIAVIAYEWALRCFIDWLIAHRRKPSTVRRFLNVLLEGSIPTVFLFLMASILGPRDALVSHAFLFYFLFILVSILHLDVGLCLFSGLVAALEYSGFAVVTLPALQSNAQIGVLDSLAFHFTRSLIFFVTGVIAALIAAQIRRQIEVSVRTVQQRDQAIRTFGQYVSPQIVEMLLHHPVERGGELRNVCVMFLDIRNFSSYAASKSPTVVMAYLNTLFGAMIEVINEHRGIVNKFLGDGFMAVFGAPVNDDDPCRHAVDASLKLIAHVGSLNASGKIPPTRIGIGLHMGQVVAGNIGTEDRKEYSVVGDVVNLAARIEQATKDFHAQLLISEAVRQNLDPAAWQGEDLGMITLRGQTHPVRIFKVA